MDQKAKPFAWGSLNVERVSSLESGTVRALSNGNALSILFDKASFVLNGEPASTVAWIGRLSIPITAPQGPMYYHETLRGALQKNADARVLLFFDLGGEIYLREYPYDGIAEKDLVVRSIYRTIGHPKDTYGISLMITIERRTPDGRALVAIDTIDVEASPHRP
jgi:hypothetical protein